MNMNNPVKSCETGSGGILNHGLAVIGIIARGKMYVPGKNRPDNAAVFIQQLKETPVNLALLLLAYHPVISPEVPDGLLCRRRKYGSMQKQQNRPSEFGPP